MSFCFLKNIFDFKKQGQRNIKYYGGICGNFLNIAFLGEVGASSGSLSGTAAPIPGFLAPLDRKSVV